MTDFLDRKKQSPLKSSFVKMWVGSWQPKTVLWLVRHLGKRNSSGTWISFLHHIALMRDSLLAQGTFNYMPWMKVVVSQVWAQGMHWDWEVWAKLLTSLKQRRCLNLFYTPNPEKHLSNQALFFLPEVLIKLFFGNMPGQSAVCTWFPWIFKQSSYWQDVC